jgi:hypothetical protein
MMQLALIAWVYWPRAEKVVPQTAFFSDVSLEQIQGLTIRDEERTAITMSLNEGRWQIQPEGYPGNPEAIQALLEKIINLKSARLVTSTKASQVRLKVAEDVFSRRVELQLADGTAKSFFLGSAPSNKTIHFRLAEQNQVYLVKDLASWEIQPEKESWWQTTYVKLPEDELVAVKINNPKSSFTLQKGAEKEWRLAETTSDQQLSQEKIQKLIAAISKISLAEYLSREAPENLGVPVCTLDYTTNSGPISLSIWPVDEENDMHTAKASNSAFYVTIRAYQLADLLQAEPSLYLREPETDTETPGAGEEDAMPAPE